MEIIFYKVGDDPRKVFKNLTNEHSVQGTCRNELDVFSPEIVMEFDCTGYNYMYIPQFERYYYINGCTIVNQGLYKVEDVKEDVLMSLNSQFINLECIIDKTESASVGDEYINDGSFIISEKTINQVYNYSQGFNDTPDFILLTAGGIT